MTTIYFTEATGTQSNVTIKTHSKDEFIKVLQRTGAVVTKVEDNKPRLYQGKYPISDDAKYVCDYVYDAAPGEPNYYYKIVRLKDDAILYSNPDKNNIINYCWKEGIAYNEISFI